MKGSANFVQLATREQLENDLNAFLAIQRIWCNYDIPENDPYNHVLDPESLALQEHNGIINKKTEYYSNILRSRVKRKFVEKTYNLKELMAKAEQMVGVNYLDKALHSTTNLTINNPHMQLITF